MEVDVIRDDDCQDNNVVEFNRHGEKSTVCSVGVKDRRGGRWQADLI